MYLLYSKIMKRMLEIGFLNLFINLPKEMRAEAQEFFLLRFPRLTLRHWFAEIHEKHSWGQQVLRNR